MRVRVRLAQRAAAALIALSVLTAPVAGASESESNRSPAASTEDVRILRERVAAFWAARLAQDAKAQWELLEPRGRARLAAQEYAGFRMAVRYVAYHVEDATVDGYFAVVKVRLMFQASLPSGRSVGIQSSLAEDYWVKIGGTWYRRLEQEPLPGRAS